MFRSNVVTYPSGAVSPKSTLIGKVGDYLPVVTA